MKSSSPSKQDHPKILYAKSDSVKVTKKKAPTSDIVQVLGRGEMVKVMERSGNRYRVKLFKGKNRLGIPTPILQTRTFGKTSRSDGFTQIERKGTAHRHRIKDRWESSRLR